MSTYPRTIESGSGESLTFLRLVTDGDETVLEVENCVQPGSGPPMHVHHLQDESLTVVSGRLAWQRPGEEPVYAGAGETVTFRAGDPHRFWNAGETELRCTGWIRPAHNVEYFLTAIYDSTRRSGGHRPSPFDAAWLLRRYRSEFDMVGIPPFVKRFVFPVQVAVGRLLGRYRRYRDAPDPVG